MFFRGWVLFRETTVYTMCTQYSLVPRPRPAFRRLQYGKVVRGPGNEATHNTCTQNKRGLGLECIMTAGSHIDTVHLHHSAQLG